MFDLFGKMGAMKQRMEETKAALDQIIIEETSVSGRIKVKVSASKNIKDIIIEPSFLQAEQKEVLEDELQLVLESALQKAELKAADEMKKIGDQLMPGLSGMF